MDKSLFQWGEDDIRPVLFFELSRGLTRESLQSMIQTIIERAKKQNTPMQGYVDLFVLAFQTRDINEGKGERQLFYWFILELYKIYPETTLLTLHLIPSKYGSWKDIRTLLEMTEENKEYKKLQDHLFNMFEIQLKEDIQNYQIRSTRELVSLCAKWSPREGRHYSWFSKRLAIKMFRNKTIKTHSLEESETRLKQAKYNKNQKDIEYYTKEIKHAKQSCYKQYRQTVAQLNKFINTTEVFMCEGKWSHIEPRRVPTKCLQIHLNAFLNKDTNGNQRSDKKDRIECANHFHTLDTQMKGDNTMTDYQIKQLDDERYDPIREICQEIKTHNRQLNINEEIHKINHEIDDLTKHLETLRTQKQKMN